MSEASTPTTTPSANGSLVIGAIPGSASIDPTNGNTQVNFTKAGTLALVNAIVVLGLVAAAVAYFTSNATGSGTAGVGTLSAPSISSATPGAGTVALSWSTVSPPG